MKETKRTFLESLISNTTKIDIKNYLKETIRSEPPVIGFYGLLTNKNINHSSYYITKEDLLDFYKFSYDLWYDFILTLDEKKYNEPTSSSIKQIKTNPEYRKENMTPKKCQQFIFETYDAKFKNSGIRFLVSQNGDDPVKYSADDFIHVFPALPPQKNKIECRLYINLKAENVIPFIKIFLRQCIANKIRPYLKFDTSTNIRNDNIVIYTNYNDVQKQIDLITEIKRTNPSLFIGANVGNPLMANLNGFIGFGEEPQYKHSSFNNERASAMSHFVTDAYKTEIKKIGHFNGQIRNSLGQTLDLRSYLRYVIISAFKRTMENRQREILARQYPSQYKDEQIRDYIEIQTKIYKECHDKLPESVELKIKEIVNETITSMQENGYIPTEINLPFKTQKTSLSHFSEYYANYVLKHTGYLEYYFPLDLNLQEKLFSVFGTKEKILNMVTDENIKPYFDAQHVSYALPFLNTETEAELKNSTSFKR